MKRVGLLSLIVVAVIVFLIGIIIWLVAFLIKDKKITVLSPIPDFLTRISNNQVSTIDLFSPLILGVQASEENGSEISAKSALIYDLTDRKTIFAKNPDVKLPIASLTKVMTAIIALENKKEDNRYLVSKDNLVGENSMGLSEGEELTLEELLYGLVLSSANDAAETLASNFPSGRDAFIKAMNDKAKALGLKDTNFTNPSGLEGDGDQYSTVSDLLVITNYAISNFPIFAKVAATIEYIVPYTETHKAFYLSNETNLLTTYPGVKGVKDGYTPEAGLCLITYLEYEGHRIIGIILGSNDRRDEMKELLDYSLKSLGIAPPYLN